MDCELLVDLKIEQGSDRVTRNRIKRYYPLPRQATPEPAPEEPAQAEVKSGSRPWDK